METLVMRTGGWLAVALLLLLASAMSIDWAFSVHMAIACAAALITAFTSTRRFDFLTQRFPALSSKQASTYDDDPIRWGVIATIFWGLAGFLAGLIIALQLAFPVLNFNLEYTTFGRLRPLHTSAVIFAFGGNALIASSYFVVQRTCRARLAFPGLARFVFWGYQLFIG
jgi:cytochrome c oxidase cbb3-type subunit 1